MKKYILILLLIIISAVPLMDLLRAGLPVTHDGPDHVARIANFYQSLTEGHIIPRWAGNLNWGYGHPILMFLYPLPSYIGSFFIAFGFSLVDSTKLVFAVSYIASVLAMFIWLRAQWGRLAGFTGAILYGFAPYRFVDIYVRGAIGEHVAFVFLPLILYGLYTLARDGTAGWRRSSMITSLAMAGLLLSHNAVSLMFLPVIGVYGWYLFIIVAKKSYFFAARAIFSLFLGFFLSAFFWMPAFFEGKYTLRDILTRGSFSGRFVPWEWFFRSAWNYGGGNEFSKEVGFAGWAAIFGTLLALIFGKRRAEHGFMWIVIIFFGVALCFMTSVSQVIWQYIAIMQKFQFPWRLLTLVVFFTSVSAAYVVCYLSGKKGIVLGVVLIALSIFSTTHMWHTPVYSTHPDSYYSGIFNSTTDTGESSPIWSVRFMEARATSPMAVIDGNAQITMGNRSSTSHSYIVESHQKTRLVENTLYFPGWNITVNGAPVALEFQDERFRGLMTFFVEPGVHRVQVTFGDTRLRQAANILSVVGILIWVYIGKSFLWKKRI